MFHVIAIDGPAASGKSTVARAVAARLHFAYINSGALYRAVTWQALQRSIPLHDDEALVAAAKETPAFAEDAMELREAAVNAAVSRLSSVPRVRELLTARMRARAAKEDVVVEGRDIGSVVFPSTKFKFYLDASPALRAQRRAAQGEQDEISTRDHADSSRRAAPLVIAPDASVIDTTNLSREEVVAEILRQLDAKGLAHDRR